MANERLPSAPCTLEELRASLLALYSHHLRQSALLTPSKHWPPSQLPQLQDSALWDPSMQPGDISLTFADIESCSLVVCLEQQYRYAVNGLLTDGLEPMEHETQHTWVAAQLMDWASSEFITEWESYGADLRSHAERCLHISELANARLVLEGADMGFAHFAQEATSFAELTIRQIALLSGLEEMSVRTAASRKGPTQLITHKNSAGRTVVSPANAKAWLIARGKYFPVIRDAAPMLLDLRLASFRTLAEMSSALRDHCSALISSGRDRTLVHQVESLLCRHDFDAVLDLRAGAENCVPLLTQLAQLLELPTELFLLRVKESSLRQQLLGVESDLKSHAQANR